MRALAKSAGTETQQRIWHRIAAPPVFACRENAHRANVPLEHDSQSGQVAPYERGRALPL
jgi:hypothetical protein